MINKLAREIEFEDMLSTYILCFSYFEPLIIFVMEKTFIQKIGYLRMKESFLRDHKMDDEIFLKIEKFAKIIGRVLVCHGRTKVSHGGCFLSLIYFTTGFRSFPVIQGPDLLQGSPSKINFRFTYGLLQNFILS